MTPMMQQYMEIKNQYKDHILMYRLGDFYEMFFDDAKTASKVLELTLTGRDCGEEERAPMCGVPFHSVEPYIAKLVSNGYKVAICEQLEDPATAKGIVKRGIIRIVTPGTVTSQEMLKEDKNNYVAALYIGEDGAALCFADVSTGYIGACQVDGDDVERRVINELAAFLPKEIITNFPLSEKQSLFDYIKNRLCCTVNENEPERFWEIKTAALCQKQFPDEKTDALPSALVCAVGAALDYIKETQKTDISFMDTLSLYESEGSLEIDASTRRNLELCESLRTGEKKGSLLWALDCTKTAGGARTLRKWVEMPLCSVAEIQRRQEAVSDLYGDFMVRSELQEVLKGVLDLERLASKLVYETANARDLRAICQSASKLPAIKELISVCPSEMMKQINEKTDDLSDICALIDAAIVDEPPFSVREGGFIRQGYNADVDYLHSVMHDGKRWIGEIEAAEREKTGIKTLRVSYNRVFGYYIEVTKSYADLVPERYIRKQTLANCERYITEELKELESSILGASDKVVKLEYDIFTQIRAHLCENIARIRSSADSVSRLDALLSLAVTAEKHGYVKPEVSYSDVINIQNGRHPVVERFTEDAFVPNDTYMDTEKNRLLLITGPNMAGKSTYMRQVALITVMAQIGSFVPATEARIGVVDRVFARVGASDDLASGTSTFMLEMNEVSYILKRATKKSLIIYDEIGRGTSTFDGMSIARAVVEYTAQKIGCKTLFATHYHELTETEGLVEGVVNYNIAAKKRGDTISFLRKIVKGAANDSYGIEVAVLAGVPNKVIKRAREVLAETEANTPERKRTREVKTLEDLNVTMETVVSDEIRDAIEAVDLNITTPLEAYDLLRKLKGLL